MSVVTTSRNAAQKLLSRLPFRYKLLLLPLLATIGFMIVLFVSFVFGQRNARLLDQVQKGYYPSVERSADL
ncbi:MAG TPA: hypothetical protein VNN08_26540, partial [Thermoanaerobaculia bacterium]|nr:hypothetical protein [Thermoanaerobaculia bacterium]